MQEICSCLSFSPSPQTVCLLCLISQKLLLCVLYKMSLIYGISAWKEQKTVHTYIPSSLKQKMDFFKKNKECYISNKCLMHYEIRPTIYFHIMTRRIKTENNQLITVSDHRTKYKIKTLNIMTIRRFGLTNLCKLSIQWTTTYLYVFMYTPELLKLSHMCFCATQKKKLTNLKRLKTNKLKKKTIVTYLKMLK